MGIQSGFLRYLSKTFPDAFTKVMLKDLSGKKIAIDTPILMNKYKHIFKESWLVYISFFVKKLIENKIIPLFVFEGKCPEEKKEEIQKRVDKRKEDKEKIQNLKDDIEEMKITGKWSKSTQSVYDSSRDKHPINSVPTVDWVEQKIKNLEKNIISISLDDKKILKFFLIL